MDTDDLVVLARARALARSGAARSIRIAAGLSLSEIGESVGASLSTVWRWEQGARSPRGERAVRYGRLLDELTQRR